MTVKNKLRTASVIAILAFGISLLIIGKNAKAQSAGTMTQFIGDRPLGDAVKVSIPPVSAKLHQSKTIKLFN